MKEILTPFIAYYKELNPCFGQVFTLDDVKHISNDTWEQFQPELNPYDNDTLESYNIKYKHSELKRLKLISESKYNLVSICIINLYTVLDNFLDKDIDFIENEYGIKQKFDKYCEQNNIMKEM